MHLNAFPHRINFDQKSTLCCIHLYYIHTLKYTYVRVDVCVFDPKIISYCPLWDSILNRTLLSTHSSELMPNAQHILILNCVPFDFEVETTKYLLLACVSVSNYQNSKSLLVHWRRLLPYSLEKAMNQDNQVIWHLLSTFIHLAFAPFANSVRVCIIISMQIPLTTTTSIWLCSRLSVCQNTSMTSIILVVEF